MKDFAKIEKYEVVDKIGEGSFGVVYRGRDPHLKREVAIKVCSVEDKGLRQRFLREAEIAGKLCHPNIVTVFAFGFQDDVPYLAQELLPGEDLDEAIRDGRKLPARTALGYLLQIAEGLAYAHGEGVVHRDIKPANIRVVGDGRVKIMDFGIAKLASAETQLTQQGVTMGTASYLPPEQVRGGEVDHRADIFSFGVLAYELLGSERPFRGSTLSALVYQILYKVPLPLASVWSECPAELSDLVGKCMEKKPERRFASFADLVPLLQKLRDEAPESRPEAAETSPHATSSLAASPATPAAEKAAEEMAGDRTRPSLDMQPTEISRSILAIDGEGGEGDLGSTRAVDPVVLEELATPAAAGEAEPDEEGDEAPTPPAVAAVEASPMAPVDRAWEEVGDGGEPGVGDDPSAVLADRGQAIGELVAKGKLEEALQHLEETYHQAKDGTLTGGIEPVVDFDSPETGEESRSGETMVDPAGDARATVLIPSVDLVGAEAPEPSAPAAERPTEPIAKADRSPNEVLPPADMGLLEPGPAEEPAQEEEEGIRWAPPPLPEPPAPASSAGVPPPLPTTARKPAAPKPAAAKPATPKPAAAKARHASGEPSPAWQELLGGRARWLLPAAVFLLAVVVAIVFWPEKAVETAPPPAPAPTAAAPPRSEAAPPRPLAPDLGLVRVTAVPWAELRSIVDAQGAGVELPPERHTPLLLRLSPGFYTLSLAHPGREEPHFCEVEVALGESADCAYEAAAPDVVGFFKESGWWR